MLHFKSILFFKTETYWKSPITRDSRAGPEQISAHSWQKDMSDGFHSKTKIALNDPNSKIYNIQQRFSTDLWSQRDINQKSIGKWNQIMEKSSKDGISGAHCTRSCSWQKVYLDIPPSRAHTDLIWSSHTTKQMSLHGGTADKITLTTQPKPSILQTQLRIIWKACAGYRSQDDQA